MTNFLVKGGQKLKGEIKITGSKNTILPCIAAAILTNEEIIFENVPNISDVSIMAKIVRKLGAVAIHDTAKKTLYISAKNLSLSSLPDDAKQLRSSILFSGALIGRLRKTKFPYPGGDAIGARPLKTHISALRDMGVIINEDEQIECDAKFIKGSKITLEESSVTATENTLLAAVLTPGETEIHLAATEPHVQELINFLNQMGARIVWAGIGILKIEGVPKLHGTKYKINPDELEISGFAALAAATRSSIFLRGVEFKYLDAVILQFDKMGIKYKKDDADNLHILASNESYYAFKLQSGLYPKLVSDHLPPFAVLATQALGQSLIHEWLYEGRLKYIEELKKMGAKTKILDPHRAIIKGPTTLKGASLVSYDVRAGLTVVIAALVAEGETYISCISHIDRGYEKIDERLRSLGADIQRLES